MKIKYLIAIFVLSFVILFAYWLKCQLGVNISKSYHLGKFIPFKYLQRKKEKMKIKYLIATFVLNFVILFAYWLKCYVSVNISESHSLSNYIPFKYLQRNNVIPVPEPGIILNDSFELRTIISNWSNLWMREKGKVTQGYDSNGINNSRCLLVKSNSTKSWAYDHKKYVEVLKGDIFSFEGFVKLQGDKISAYAGVAAFDKHKKPIKWNYISEKVDKTKKWIKIEKEFVVTEGIDYISFRLSGVGIGGFKFDDISFRKEGLSNQ